MSSSGRKFGGLSFSRAVGKGKVSTGVIDQVREA